MGCGASSHKPLSREPSTTTGSLSGVEGMHQCATTHGASPRDPRAAFKAGPLEFQLSVTSPRQSDVQIDSPQTAFKLSVSAPAIFAHARTAPSATLVWWLSSEWDVPPDGTAVVYSSSEVVEKLRAVFLKTTRVWYHHEPRLLSNNAKEWETSSIIGLLSLPLRDGHRLLVRPEYVHQRLTTSASEPISSSLKP